MRRKTIIWIIYLLFFLPAVLFPLILVLDVSGKLQELTRVQIRIGTPIPTLIPATLPAPMVGAPLAAGSAKCSLTAETLLRTWVEAGAPESDSFEFTDMSDILCQATFTEVQVLFNEDNLWYSGANSCITCHHANVTVASAQLDMSSYEGILAGSRRASAEAIGTDILGDGNWEQSLLCDQLFISMAMPLGRPSDAVPDEGPTVLAGSPKPVP